MNNDLISRQAAISAFDCTNELIVGGAANAQNVVNYINKVVGKIKDLPSTKPEVIRCKDCKHWYKDADSGMSCEYTEMSQPEDGFCNWAERRGKSDE